MNEETIVKIFPKHFLQQWWLGVWDRNVSVSARITSDIAWHCISTDFTLYCTCAVDILQSLNLSWHKVVCDHNLVTQDMDLWPVWPFQLCVVASWLLSSAETDFYQNWLVGLSARNLMVTSFRLTACGNKSWTCWPLHDQSLSSIITGHILGKNCEELIMQMTQSNL